MNNKLKRFEQAIAKRKDVNLAQFYNEIKADLENPYSVELMTAKTEWMLMKNQAENHKLMIEFVEVMDKRRKELGLD